MASNKHDREIDEVTGTETTGHEWDGIRELNTPLPKWWIYIFYATVVWSVGYWVVYPSWPLLTIYTTGVIGYSQRTDVDNAVQALKDARAVQGAALETASLAQIEADPGLLTFAQAWGRSAFGDNCATCHGSGAAGGAGYPNLNDDAWLWGGTLDDIQQTLKAGIRSTHPDTRVAAMPSFKELLTSAQVDDAAAYVLSLSGQAADKGSAAAGATVFAENCAACHGETGKGMREFGAPNLTDADWLYGSQPEAIRTQIAAPRNGVMPAWEGRLDPVTIKALAVYVHSLGGGE